MRNNKIVSRFELIADRDAQIPDLISGNNSAEALPAKIQAIIDSGTNLSGTDLH